MGKLTLRGSRSFTQTAMFDLEIEIMGEGGGERRKDAARRAFEKQNTP